MTIINIEETNDTRMERWADRFTSIYIADGNIAAGAYLVDFVPEKYHEELQPFVEKSFDAKGYDLR